MFASTLFENMFDKNLCLMHDSWRSQWYSNDRALDGSLRECGVLAVFEGTRIDNGFV